MDLPTAAGAPARPWTLEDLLAMDGDQLHAIVAAAEPLDPDAVAGHAYTGIDLSMPPWFHKLMWRTFRKTFYRDPQSGVVRGWNVKVEQCGWDAPPPPKRDRRGVPLTFGHYELKSAEGLDFPRGWRGAHVLDYRDAGNPWTDWPARAGWCPLVAVNRGDMGLLLGWEIFRLGPLAVPLRDYWVLRREGPLAASDVLARPDHR